MIRDLNNMATALNPQEQQQQDEMAASVSRLRQSWAVVEDRWEEAVTPKRFLHVWISLFAF